MLMSSDPGDIILDPFVGTGTTAIAAKRLGRHFIGIELDAAYAQIATEKVAREKPSTYNGKYVSIFLDGIVSICEVDCAELFPQAAANVKENIDTTPSAVQLSFYEESEAYTANNKEM